MLIGPAGGFSTMPLMVENLAFRPATMADAQDLWTWRNEEEARAASFSMDAIPWSDHQVWLEKILTSEDDRVLILELNGSSCGSVRFSRHAPSSWEISIVLASEVRGKRLSSAFLRLALQWLPTTSDADEVVAYTKSQNHRSLKAFEHAGFSIVSRNVDRVELRRNIGA